MARSVRFAGLGVLAAALVLLAIGFRYGGSFLVVDNRQKSDAIVVTQGDSLDAGYWLALRLLKEGYGRELLLDARSNKVFFGRTQAEVAGEFIQKTATGVPGRVRVCAIVSDTTARETYEVDRCLKASSIHSVLLVVDAYHSRRSLSMFSRLLPGYRWSIAAVPKNEEFGEAWWRKRTWIRTAVVQWQHLLWWEMIDRWRFAPVA